jgi:DNA-binding winged helix-turn-helix (wHTH) protein
MFSRHPVARRNHEPECLTGKAGSIGRGERAIRALPTAVRLISHLALRNDAVVTGADLIARNYPIDLARRDAIPNCL